MSEQSAEVFTSETGFPAESRFLDGHFPGRPIVPGAVILGQLASFLMASGRRIARVERMKFSRPLLPDKPFEIRLLHRAAAHRVEWRDDIGVFATARVVLLAPDG
jgi:3-hydroxyacyl-[acyl-carrier-protein] dehydratase